MPPSSTPSVKPETVVQPETVDWQTACSFVRRMPSSDDAAAPSRMATIIAPSWQRGLLASNYAWSQAAVGAAMSEADQISVTRALDAAGAQLSDDLSSRGVLCDNNRPCVVKLEGAPRTGPRLRFLLSVCLPNATLRSRLCEPFGESRPHLTHGSCLLVFDCTVALILHALHALQARAGSSTALASPARRARGASTLICSRVRVQEDSNPQIPLYSASPNAIESRTRQSLVGGTRCACKPCRSSRLACAPAGGRTRACGRCRV